MSTSNIFDLADTWNDAAVTFTAIKMDVTDTASAGSSRLLDLQVGGASRFSVGKNGFATVNGPNNSQVLGLNGSAVGIGNSFGNLGFYRGGTLQALVSGNTVRMQSNTGSFSWGSSQDLELFRDAADTLAQRRGTNAQTFNLYNTYTDASNHERARLGWAGNVFEIKPEAAGTGTVRNLYLNASNIRVAASGGGNGFDFNGFTTFKINGVQILRMSTSALSPRTNGLSLGDPSFGWAALCGQERATDPADPSEGNYVLWQSDGTGSGDDGDILIKITAGGVTKTVTLVDFSAA